MSDLGIPFECLYSTQVPVNLGQFCVVLKGETIHDVVAMTVCLEAVFYLDRASMSVKQTLTAGCCV